MSDSGVISINSKETWQLMQDNPKAILIDIRSEMEFLFIGHPKGAIHVPWIDEPDWIVNPRFVPEVRKVMLGGLVHDPDDTEMEVVPVLLICRSGRRSLEAGKALIKGGFTKVYNVSDGFEGPLDDNHHRCSISGWRFEGLPWEQC